MPYRKTPLVNNQIYHVFNRGINKQPIFYSNKNYIHAISTIKYYLVHKPPIAFSKFSRLSPNVKEVIINDLKKKPKGVDIISYALMPNHYHFLIRQNVDNGIYNFIRNFQISYTKYINTRYERSGALIQGQFKAILIESDEQLIHVSRYIHLNPYTSYILKELEALKNYYWSSLPNYLGTNNDDITSENLLMSYFKNKDSFWNFIINQADYQRSLYNIKHLTGE